MRNESPWLHELDKERPIETLRKDQKTDVVIVGAGIAGIATAFFTLKYTKHKVILVEAGKLAHGATGHNAGQVVSYFERGFANLADEFDLDLARDAQESIEDAWDLIDEIVVDTKLDIFFSKFIGHAGLSSKEQVLEELRNNVYRQKTGLEVHELKVVRDIPFAKQISDEYEGLFDFVDQEYVKNILETDKDLFIALTSSKKGCLNSALFCEKVLMYLYQTYPDRCKLFEHSPIQKIVLHKDKVILATQKNTIEGDFVVLCTNGFENMTILSETGLDSNTKFHHHVYGKVGYMAGYLKDQAEEPIAISYYTDPLAGAENSYFYLTRRHYSIEDGVMKDLIAIGGPDADLIEKAEYSGTGSYPKNEREMIADFVRDVYKQDITAEHQFRFKWHGLMGYTKSGVRMIGPDPQNPKLMYNLGCNGVGILPSVFGGRKISRHLAGESQEPSIFDVPLF